MYLWIFFKLYYLSKVRRTPRLIASGAVHFSEVFFRSELKDGTCASPNSDT